MELSPHSLTPRYAVVAFVVWLGSLSSRPLAHSVPYLRDASPRAAPKCISGRTSYLRVRLAFHPYPQLIRDFCNNHRFGPSRPVTDAAAWPWVAHTVSGLLLATNRAYHTRFPSGSGYAALTRPLTVTRRVILQKARDHRGTSALRLSLHGCGRFQALFHSPRRGAFHRSLTVLCAIGHDQ